MMAFEVYINGHRLCLASVGVNGVLTTIINWVGDPNRETETFLNVGGLDSNTDEHLRWNVPSIGVGAEILVRIVESESADPPDERYPCEPPDAVERCRSSLRFLSERMTTDERRHLLTELIQQVEDLSATGQ